MKDEGVLPSGGGVLAVGVAQARVAVGCLRTALHSTAQVTAFQKGIRKPKNKWSLICHPLCKIMYCELNRCAEAIE